MAKKTSPPKKTDGQKRQATAPAGTEVRLSGLEKAILNIIGLVFTLAFAAILLVSLGAIFWLLFVIAYCLGWLWLVLRIGRWIWLPKIIYNLWFNRDQGQPLVERNEGQSLAKMAAWWLLLTILILIGRYGWPVVEWGFDNPPSTWPWLSWSYWF